MTTKLEKPRYFPGEFLAAGDYSAEQDYLARLRHTHDGVLHTWGIATGLAVSLSANPLRVTVSPGIAVDPSGQLVSLTEPRDADLPVPFVDSRLVLTRTEEVIPPLQPDGLPRLRESAELSWEPLGAPDLEPRLVLASVSAGPTLDFTLRRHAGLEVGALRFVSPRLARTREPSLLGWSAAEDHGVRISANELRIQPLQAPREATVSLQGGMLGIGTTLPTSPLDIREPNAPLVGPGLLSSDGTLVTGTDPTLGRLLAVGDRILTRDRQGQQVQSAIAAVLPDGRVVTASPLEAQDALWQFRRESIARFASPDGRALLTCDATAQVRIGRDLSGTPARLAVSGGDVLLRGGAVEFQADGRIQDLTGAQEIRFNQREGFLGLRTAGDLHLRASTAPSPLPFGLFLAASGNVGLGTDAPGDALVVEGALRSVGDEARGIAGGFVFPDGTVQETAEIALPIGGIIDWWRPNAQVQIPGEYRICDGSTVDDEDSPFYGKQLPSLTSRFIRGVGSVNDVGPGGSDTHVHVYTVPAHNHPFQHTHPDYAGLSGQANGNDGPADRLASQFCDRGHVHNFRAQIFSSATTNTRDNGDAGTQAPSGPASLLPPFYGLLKLIRIK
ncbi:hypothetical protein D7V97_05045 [Corallococcus sp. CA053C]|uniref:hypothetical protein n=1 Tax=Corallococcus sp. CA053C TaxID=2316732 RepID=UPI000EA3C5D4|nr:hypothetical protein [Corallococcus sp. CA053C]RKH13583.1 hypothetical protein D7V97_05045 [Corallococcus sp. CA053C]